MKLRLRCAFDILSMSTIEHQIFIVQNGSSPLHLASYEGHIDIVKILLEHGAKVNATEEVKMYNSLNVEFTEKVLHFS